MTDRNPPHDRVCLSVKELVALVAIEHANADDAAMRRLSGEPEPTRAARLRHRATELARRPTVRGLCLIAIAIGVALVSVAPVVVGLSSAVVLLLMGTSVMIRGLVSRPRSSRPDRLDGPDHPVVRRDRGRGRAHLPHW